MGLQVNWRACKMLHSTQILCKGMNLRQVPRESTKHKMVPKSKRLFVAFWTIVVDWFHTYLNQEWYFLVKSRLFSTVDLLMSYYQVDPLPSWVGGVPQMTLPDKRKLSQLSMASGVVGAERWSVHWWSTIWDERISRPNWNAWPPIPTSAWGGQWKTRSK